jgi:hypothetical protein
MASIQKQFGQVTATSPVSSNSQLSPDKLAKVKDIYANAGILNISAVLPTQDQGGPSYHYQFTLSKDNLLKAMTQADAIIGTSPQVSSSSDPYRAELDKIEFLPSDIWIGQKDLQLHKLSLSLRTVASANDPNSGNATLTLEQHDFNKPLALTPPSPTISIEEAAASIMNSFAASAPKIPAATYANGSKP